MCEPLTLCPSWHVDRPDMPSRSRLYHLLPLGLGTPFVESLSSYLARLAQAHSVSVSKLLAQEVLPLFDPLKPLAPAMINSWFKNIYTINGLARHATNFVQALQQLTHHHNLRCLTMLSWTNVISTKNLLRRTRAWCPACYQSWLDAGQIIYEPLLFALKPMSACPIHHLPLTTHCPDPDCRRTLPLLAARYQPGYCSGCKRWLGQASPGNQTLSQDELAWQTWVSRSLGQLLAATPSFSVLPPKERIASALSTHLEQLTAGNLAALARIIPFPQTTLHCWRDGSRLPQVTSLLQLSYFLGIAPLALLTQDPLVVNPTSFTFLHDNPFLYQSRQNVSSLSSHQLRSALEAVLSSNEKPPPSLNQTVKRLGYHTPRLLRRQFPELCRAISTRYLNYHQAQIEQKKRVTANLETVFSSSSSVTISTKLVEA